MTRHEIVGAVLGIAIIFGACGKAAKTENSTSYWNGSKQASTLTVGPHVVTIPAGWRSMAELRKPDLVPGPGTAGMTPESKDHGALRTNIILTWAPFPPGSVDAKNPPCADIASATAKEFKTTATDVASIRIDGDAGCRFSYANADARVSAVVRFQGDHELVLNWTHMTSLTDTSDASIWRDLLTGLHISG
jgi:hypothetical protein